MGKEICGVCVAPIGSQDFAPACSRCQKKFHHKCWGLDDKSYKALALVPIAVLYCEACKNTYAKLEERVQALEARIKQPPAIDEATITRIVSAVVKEVLPQALEAAREAAAEAVEMDAKKNSLVVVGLPENVDCRGFASNVCDKLTVEVDPADIVDVFRDGHSQPDRPRIVKVKFGKSASRRTFLTGLHNVRNGVAGGDRVWVRPDLTYRQRQRDRVLREELQRRRDAGEQVKISRGLIVPKS